MKCNFKQSNDNSTVNCIQSGRNLIKSDFKINQHILFGSTQYVVPPRSPELLNMQSKLVPYLPVFYFKTKLHGIFHPITGDINNFVKMCSVLFLEVK